MFCFLVGMDGTKHQSLLQPTEESGLSIKALPSHDFCDNRLYVTPSAYRFLSHEVKEVDGELHIFFTKINHDHYECLKSNSSSPCLSKYAYKFTGQIKIVFS